MFTVQSSLYRKPFQGSVNSVQMIKTGKFSIIQD